MKSVVLCGSRRFKPAIRSLAEKLREYGAIVYEPYLHSGQKEWEDLSPAYQHFIALGLTHDHVYKIALADVVYVYNQDGYVGASVTLEMGAALALRKPIYAFSGEDPELCRRVLIRGILKTAEEIFALLNQ